MIINIKTVLMGLAVGYLVFGSMLSLFQRDEVPEHKIPFWAVGKILQGIGMLLLLGRGTSPDFISMTMANGCLLCGFAYECWAMFHLSGRPVTGTVHFSAVAVIILICLVMPYFSVSNRILIASLIHTLFLILPGWALLSVAGKKSGIRSYLGFSMWVLAVVLLFRAGWAMMNPDGFNVFSENIVHFFTFTALYFFMLTNGFGMLLLAKEMVDQKLQETLTEQSIILDTLPTGLCILRDRVIDRCNPAMEKMFGFTTGTLVGKSTRCLFESDEAYLETGRTAYMTIEQTGRFAGEVTYMRQNGEKFWVWEQGKSIFPERAAAYAVFSYTDITDAKKQQETLIRQKEALEATLARIKRLEGIISICMYCKKIRNEKADWERLEKYFTEHSESQFTHCICPECSKKYLPEYVK